MAGLILDNIKKSFGDTQVLKGVSLHVATESSSLWLGRLAVVSPRCCASSQVWKSRARVTFFWVTGLWRVFAPRIETCRWYSSPTRSIRI